MWVRPTCCLDALDHSLDLTFEPALDWTIAWIWLWAGFGSNRTPPKPPPRHPAVSKTLCSIWPPPKTALDTWTFDVNMIAGLYIISDAFLNGFWKDFPPNLASQRHLKPLKIEAKIHSIFGFIFQSIFDAFFIEFLTSRNIKIKVFLSKNNVFVQKLASRSSHRFFIWFCCQLATIFLPKSTNIA